jgi:hypothetical protein
LAGMWLSHLNPAQTFRYDQPISREEARQNFYDSLEKAARFARSDVARAEYDALRARFDIRLNDYVTAYQSITESQPDNYRPLATLIGAHILVGDYDEARRVGLKAKALAMADSNPDSWVFQYLHRVDVPAAMEMAEAAVNQPNVSAAALYQAHRVYLYAGEVERAAQLARRHNDRETEPDSVAMVNVRQACAEGRVADADAEFVKLVETTPGKAVQNEWLFLKTLGRNEDANDAVRYLDEGDGLYALSGFLHYTHFDPNVFPHLRARLESQGITRPPPTTIPFACRQ